MLNQQLNRKLVCLQKSRYLFIRETGKDKKKNLLKQTLEVSERGIVVGVKFEFMSGIGFYSYYREVRLGHLFILAHWVR